MQHLYRSKHLKGGARKREKMVDGDMHLTAPEHLVTALDFSRRAMLQRLHHHLIQLLWPRLRLRNISRGHNVARLPMPLSLEHIHASTPVAPTQDVVPSVDRRVEPRGQGSSLTPVVKPSLGHSPSVATACPLLSMT